MAREARINSAEKIPGNLLMLSAESLSRFDQDGFLQLQDFCDPAELLEVRHTIDDLFRRGVGRAEGAQYDMLGHDDDPNTQSQPTLINPHHFSARLRSLDVRDRAAKVARQLLGPKATPSFEHVILKPAGHSGATPWHQDEAYRVDPNFAYSQVSFWVPLQNVTERNGCMQFIPGSNRGDVLTHRSPENDPQVHALECAGEFDVASAVACPMDIGGATVHHGRTLHFAGPNFSSEPRYAYILAFEVPPVALRSKRSFQWNDEKRAAHLKRRRDWRVRGGIFIEAGRKFRMGLWRQPGRFVFELRRGLRALWAYATSRDSKDRR